MKIIYILNSLRESAQNTVAVNVASYLSGVGNDVSIYAFSTRSVDYKLPSKIKVLNISNLLFEASKADIVHSHAFRSDLIAALICIFLYKKLNLVMTAHNFLGIDEVYLYGPFRTFVYRTIWPLLWRVPATVFVLSHFQKKFYKNRWLKNKNIEIVPNGINFTEIVRSNKVNSDESEGKLLDFLKINRKRRILGVICNLTHRKGIHFVIDFVSKHRDDFVFVIGGNGPAYEDLVNLTHNYNLDDSILFYGYVNNFYKLVKYFDVFIFPSQSEAFGLTVIEAVACGIPVVANNIEPISSNFKDMVTFCDCTDTEKMCLAVSQALQLTKEDLELRRTLAKNNFSAEVSGLLHLKYYEKLLRIKATDCKTQNSDKNE